MSYDVVIVGSGFGGSMAARVLVEAGLSVLMLEQGDWIEPGPHNRAWSVRWKDRTGFCAENPYRVEGESRKTMGAFQCVGGTSVFYGGVGMRLRPRDFGGYREISGDVRWPVDYSELRPHYHEVERILGIAGDEREDAAAPPRAAPLPRPARPLSPTSEVIARAARRRGLHPFRLPMALNRDRCDRSRCDPCDACDGFPCSGKNDLATVVLPELVDAGMDLRPNTVVTRLEADAGRVTAAHAVDRRTGVQLRFEADRFVVAAGALATPHLLLTSGLEHLCPAGHAVGRYLMRHCNGIALAGAPSPVGGADGSRKQLGIHDFYFGDDDQDLVHGKLGAIQQLRAVRIALAMAPLPTSVRRALYPFMSRVVGFIVMAEDQPDPANRVYLDSSETDAYGRPVPRIHHRHTPRDRRARRALLARATEVLREASAAFTFTLPVKTFSHALGTVRMGQDPERFPVAPDGRYRGVDSLWITDASVFPTAGSVNPSLTIAANASRIAQAMVGLEGVSRADPKGDDAVDGAPRRRREPIAMPGRSARADT